MVERYRLFRDAVSDCYCDIDVAANGNYVRADDYDALAAQLANLRAWATEESCVLLPEEFDAIAAGEFVDAEVQK